MLFVSAPQPVVAQSPVMEQHSGIRQISVSEFVEILRRQAALILGCLVAAVALGAVHFYTTPSIYTASTYLMIDPRRMQLSSPQQAAASSGMLDSTAVESQIEVLRSDPIALEVIAKLNLMNDANFMNEQPSLLSSTIRKVASLVRPSSGEPLSDYEHLQVALDIFKSRLSVNRIGVTYVIRIDYRSQNPARAAEIANAVSDSYVDGEQRAKHQIAERAGSWLQGRIEELREQANAAERDVQEFKAANNLIGTGRVSVSEQQLSELNTQLVIARAQTAEAKARLDQVDKVNSEGIPEAATTEALRDSVVTQLRQQLLELTQREADWVSRYGTNHPVVATIRNSMRENQRSMTTELQRISNGYRSDYQIAQARQDALEKGLAELIKISSLANQAQVRLRELESISQNYKVVYDSLLRRHVEAAEQQSFPIAEARIITAATPPIDKSAPKGSVILGVSGIVGLAAGLSLAFLREAMDSSLRTPADVQSFVGVPYLGSLPVIPSKSESSSTRGKGAVEERKRIKAQSSILSFAVEQPFSEFAETVRRIKVAADMSPSGTKAKVIGVISSVSGEGRTTLASNLAQVAAESGARVLLLDLDLRRPALSSDIAQTETTGFRDGLAGEQSLYHEVWHDSITRLEFLPSTARKDLQQAAEGASTPDIPGAFASFRIAYDYVIIDLAPVSYSVDAKVISPHVDGFVFVIEAGRTPRQFVGDALTEIMSLRSKVLGIVLNKTKPSKVWKIARRSGERRLV